MPNNRLRQTPQRPLAGEPRREACTLSALTAMWTHCRTNPNIKETNMKRLFLSSSFADVVSIFTQFADDTREGKTVTFIATASIPEKVKFYVKAGKKALEKNGFNIYEL